MPIVMGFVLRGAVDACHFGRMAQRMRSAGCAFSTGNAPSSRSPGAGPAVRLDGPPVKSSAATA